MSIDDLKDRVFKAINALGDSSPSGRASWITGHTAANIDGTVTVAFRSKYGSKTATFKVGSMKDAKTCCKIMREETRGT